MAMRYAAGVARATMMGRLNAGYLALSSTKRRENAVNILDRSRRAS